MNDDELQLIENVLKTARLKEQKEKLDKTKIFKPYYIRQNDNCATFELHSNYIFLESPLYDIQSILKKYTTREIYDKSTNKRYYLFGIPTKYTVEERRELKQTLKDLSVHTQDYFDLSPQSEIFVFYNNNNIDFDTYNQKYKSLVAQLTAIDTLTYSPIKTPKFYLFTPPTLEKFLSDYAPNDMTPYDFFIRVILPQTLINHTHLTAQTRIRTIQANSADISALLPTNLPIKSLYNKQFKNYRIRKTTNNNLIFTFKESYIEHKHSLFNTCQHMELPVNLFLQAFSAQALGKNGLRFLLCILYGYHAKNNLVYYKPSTFIRQAQISTSRGINYTVAYINKRFNYLREIGLTTSTPVLTKDDLKFDTAFKVHLKQLKYLHIRKQAE